MPWQRLGISPRGLPTSHRQRPIKQITHVRENSRRHTGALAAAEFCERFRSAPDRFCPAVGHGRDSVSKKWAYRIRCDGHRGPHFRCYLQQLFAGEESIRLPRVREKIDYRLFANACITAGDDNKIGKPFASWVPVNLGLVYLVREPRRSTAPKSRLIPNENVLSRKGTLRL